MRAANGIRCELGFSLKARRVTAVNPGRGAFLVIWPRNAPRPQVRAVPGLDLAESGVV